MVPASSLSTVTVLTAITATSSSEQRKPISLNSTALKSLARSGKVDHALRLIESQPSDLRCDAEAYTLLLHACISRKSLSLGRRLHHHLRSSGENLLADPKIRSKLITLFSVCGRLDEARSVFRDDGLASDESVWVAMAIGFSKNGSSERALALYSEMLSRSVRPGNFSFSTALRAAGKLRDLRLGRAVHAQTLKREEALDQVASNALLGLYLNCGSSEDAHKLFDEMPQRNAASWNSLISNFVSRDLIFEALEAFRKMQREGTRFSWVTLTSVLSACARSTALMFGKEIHAQMVKSDERPDLPSINSLLDMYAKCGEIEYCRKVFDETLYKDSISWNTMINGYSMNGLTEEATKLFDSMLNPDGVTFIALLSGFSHAGLTEKGKTLFDEMKSVHGIKPEIEHYACLVDLLGRSGRINEALRVIETMPMKPGSSIWGSLLNSSRLHNDLTLGEFAANHLFELEPRNPGNYVMLSNIYAEKGLWERVKRLRERMERNGMKKSPGCSWIQIQDGIHTFVAGGSFEFRNSPEFEEVSEKLRRGLEEEGYRPDTSVVLHDVGEETKESWVCGHSERIATIFALVNAPKGVPIRVTKNLRVCDDCHSWMKCVSKVAERVIIVRDTNRFHHFRGGNCSCKDYW